MFVRLTVLAAGAVLAGPSLYAQQMDEAGLADPAAQPPAASLLPSEWVVPIHTAPDDPIGGAYGIWAGGRDYKVSFHGRPTFVPYLGASYPHNQELEWSTRSIKVGSATLVAPGARAHRRQSDHRYEYDYGAVVETYDVLSHGLEQSFVIPRRLATPGDFVVEGAFRSAMVPVAEFQGQHRAIEFADAQGQVLVRYGEAFAIDAANRKLPLLTSVRGERVTLTIPSSFLAKATYPVVLDPLTTPVQLNAGASILESRVCRDDRHNAACLAYTRAVSATDADCYGWIAPDDLSSIGTNVFLDVTTSWSTPQVSTCNVGTAVADRFVICLQRNFSTQTGIRYWNQNPTDLTLNNSVGFLSTASMHNWNPDCGGIEAYDQNGSGAAGNTAILVWQRDPGGSGGPEANNGANSELYGIVLTIDGTAGTVTPGTEFAIGSSGSSDYEYPSVTKVAAGDDPNTGLTDWVVAYQQYNNGINGDDWDAVARRVFSDGTFDSRTWVPTVNTGAHRLDVRVAGQRGRYLVLYGRVDQVGTLTKVSSQRSNIVLSERFDYPVGGNITKRPADELSLLQSNTTLRTHAVAYDADNDSIWFSAWAAPGGTRRIFAQRLGYNGVDLEVERAFPIGGEVLTESDMAFNDDANVGLFLYGGTSGALSGAVFEHAPETPWTVTATSCSNASISWRLRDAEGNSVFNSNQDQQVGLEFTYCDVSGMPSTTLSILGVGFDPASIDLTGVPGVGAGCFNLLDTVGPGFVTFFDFQLGSTASWKLVLPEFLSGTDVVYCQVWHLDAAGTAFLSSSRLEVPLAK